jgi:hypothetical protein
LAGAARNNRLSASRGYTRFVALAKRISLEKSACIICCEPLGAQRNAPIQSQMSADHCSLEDDESGFVTDERIFSATGYYKGGYEGGAA